MIILDTNVISEVMKAEPDKNVLRWLNGQAVETLFTTAITVAELRAGIEVLPSGRRKDDLLDRFRKTAELFSGRILSFDTGAAFAFGELVLKSRNSGRAIGFQDGLIAAIANDHDFLVATRDTSPFEAAGIETIDPWLT